MNVVAPSPPRYAGPPSVPGYVLDEFLGRGSSAVVWAATDEVSGERVAVKLIAPGVGADGSTVLAASDRERALGRSVETVHLVRARDRVELPNGAVAVVLDLADGGSLRDVVTIRGSLPLGEVVTALTPLATALSALHQAGIVHADLAPGNVLFTTDGRPVLADLSSARLVDEDPWPDEVSGTPGFVAPEVAPGHPPGPAADVWSLGALAWYARTGGSPPPNWVGDLHWTSAHTGEAAVGSLDDVTVSVGPELRPVLLRMLADDPLARPSAAEAALALYRLAAPEPVGLVGHHPDPAAAVTSRIRHEAAQIRSRSELRERAQTERRRASRERRRRRAARMLHPRATAPARSPSPRRLRWRLTLVALLGLLLAGGMFASLRYVGATPIGTTGPVSSIVGSGETTPAPGPGGPAPNLGSPSAGVATSPPSPGQATSPAATSALTDGTVSENAARSGSAVDPVRDPVAALQRLADVRAQALQSADPVALLPAEPAGSAAYQSDASTIARLREQRQRYADLTFSVRSAEVERHDPTVVVLRAVVDRSGYTVDGEDGSVQTLPPASGAALSYTLTESDAGWLLTDVGPG